MKSWYIHVFEEKAVIIAGIWQYQPDTYIDFIHSFIQQLSLSISIPPSLFSFFFPFSFLFFSVLITTAAHLPSISSIYLPTYLSRRGRKKEPTSPLSRQTKNTREQTTYNRHEYQSRTQQSCSAELGYLFIITSI